MFYYDSLVILLCIYCDFVMISPILLCLPLFMLFVFYCVHEVATLSFTDFRHIDLYYQYTICLTHPLSAQSNPKSVLYLNLAFLGKFLFLVFSGFYFYFFYGADG